MMDPDGHQKLSNDTTKAPRTEDSKQPKTHIQFRVFRHISTDCVGAYNSTLRARYWMRERLEMKLAYPNDDLLKGFVSLPDRSCVHVYGLKIVVLEWKIPAAQDQGLVLLPL